MLSHTRKTALAVGFPVRVIRRDYVPRCGPIGGIYTGLKSTRADAAIFLACDMPFVRAELIKLLIEENNRSGRALFVRSKGSAGFPLLMQRKHLERVEQQIKRKQLSLQALAKSLGARIVLPPRSWRDQLLNVNTLSDWKNACEMWQDGEPQGKYLAAVVGLSSISGL
jgi:molybdopterin-guanine dinucleotide biosynthesis protein A